MVLCHPRRWRSGRPLPVLGHCNLERVCCRIVRTFHQTLLAQGPLPLRARPPGSGPRGCVVLKPCEVDHSLGMRTLAARARSPAQLRNPHVAGARNWCHPPVRRSRAEQAIETSKLLLRCDEIPRFSMSWALLLTVFPCLRERGFTGGRTGKKTPGGAGTHTGHTGHADAQRHTDHTDEPHNHPWSRPVGV